VTVYLFDADGVLQSSAAPWTELFAEVLPAGADVRAFLGEFLAVEREFLIKEGDLGAAIAPVLQRWRSPVSPARALEAICRIDVDGEALALVEELRREGHLCALASNQNPVRASFMSRQLRYDERFDRQYCSCHLGCAKPDPAYFGAILTDLGRRADEMIFIDDKPENVEAATAAGMRGIAYERCEGVEVLRQRLAEAR
jgi:putative hydrolase of the HAD superfamily